MTFLRNAALVAVLFSIPACGGSGGGGPFGGGGGPTLFACNPGTQVYLANPQNGQNGVGSISQIEIVANGNSNTLGQSYSQWNLSVQDSFGNFIGGNSLNPSSDPNGYHPFASDYFYTSSFPSLQTGRTYTVSLAQNGLCTPEPLGSFST